MPNGLIKAFFPAADPNTRHSGYRIRFGTGSEPETTNRYFKKDRVSKSTIFRTLKLSLLRRHHREGARVTFSQQQEKVTKQCPPEQALPQKNDAHIAVGSHALPARGT